MQQLQETSNNVAVLAVLINGYIARMRKHEDNLFSTLSTVPTLAALFEAFSKALDDMTDSVEHLIEGLSHEIEDII